MNLVLKYSSMQIHAKTLATILLYLPTLNLKPSLPSVRLKPFGLLIAQLAFLQSSALCVERRSTLQLIVPAWIQMS